ncbi:MAG: glycerol-3-phosphate 1-O-acyltransferase PlsY [Verrucomicrobiota bacterium]|nr:glycerol-3-phosphate 1-O-acyltransferase PlsY [Verrucomicrobiota bacterium]
MEVLVWLLAGFIGYLFGSLPTGYIAGRFKGLDLRKVGSGNIGATNAVRNLGVVIGIVVLLVDVIKGLIPCIVFPKLIMKLFPDGYVPHLEYLSLILGVAAILGHNFSCWLGFKGGKGVATTAGVVGGLALIPFIICFFSWLLTLLVSRYVSVASIVAAIVLPLAMAIWPNDLTNRFGLLFWAFLILGVMVIWKHGSNIQNLMNGTEHRLFDKKSPNK